MNYSKIYHSIIENARSNPREGYTEKHHIIPRSLGGSDEASNLVRLTAKEHFLCHRLLTKMYEGKAKAKMIHAVWAMTVLETEQQQRHKVTSNTYKTLREDYAKLVSERMKGNVPWNTGGGYKTKPHSDETKQKISKTLLGHTRTEESIKKQSESWRKNFEAGKITPYVRTPEQRKEHAEKLKNRVISEEERVNYLESMKPKYICEHCGKEGLTKGNYLRWHHDKCKNK